jgi:hypothetical protein
MMKRLTQTPTRATTPVVKHLAFAVIGAALLAEATVASALIASGDTTATLLTAEPVYRLHFAAVAAYSSVADYTDQLFAAFDLSSIARSLTAFAAERISEILPVAVQVNNNQIDIVLIGH